MYWDVRTAHFPGETPLSSSLVLLLVVLGSVVFKGGCAGIGFKALMTPSAILLNASLSPEPFLELGV